MAKACKYRLPGQETWMSEDDFKKSLADGLLDKFILDDKASIPSLRGFKADATAAEKFKAPVTEAKQTYSDVQKVTEDSYYDNVSNNLIEKDGKNWNVKNEVTGEVYHTAKSLKDATNWQETENQIIGRSVESKASETAPTEVKTETAPVAETKAEPTAKAEPTTKTEPKPTTKKETTPRRNIKKVSVKLTQGQVNTIKRTPTFKKYFSDSQIENLKEGDNVLSMNNVSFGNFKRMGIGEVTDITEQTTTKTTEPTTKAEPKPTAEKVERKGFVEVEAETRRGTKTTYMAEVSEAEQTATIKPTYDPAFGGIADNKEIPNLPISVDSKGNRYVQTKGETRVYIDKVKEAPKAKEAPVKEEIQGKGQPTKVKIYAREPKLDDRGMPILTKYTREVEFTKNKRAKSDEIAWETTVNGEKVKATKEQVERIEKALAEQPNKTTKQKISDAFDSLKIDTKGKTFSSLIPPGAINKIIELAKRLVLSGYDVVSAVNEATTQVIDKLKSNKLISDEQAKEIADFAKSDDFVNDIKKASEGEVIEPLSSVKKSKLSPIAQKLFDRSNKRLTDQEWINLGKEAIETGTIKPKQIIDEINAGDRDLMERPLNMLEQVSLMVYNKQIDTNIQNKKSDLAKPDLNDKKRQFIDKEISDLQNEKFNLQLVLAESNYQKGWSLQFNRAMIDNDYNAEFQINSYKANNVNGNNEIPKEIEDKFRELEAIIKENEKKLAEREAEIQKLQDNQLMDDLKAGVKNQKKNKVVTESKFTVSADGKIKVPTAMIREFVEGGVKTIEELTDKVMQRFKSENPGVDVSERQIRDAITGYGITVNMSQDEINAAISEMKDIGRKISELEDLEKGIKKAKNETKRKELTDRQRYLKYSVQQALDALPLSVEEKETIEANRLETYKRRQKSTLAKLNYLNENKLFAKKQVPNPVKMDKKAKDLANKIRLAKDQFDAEQQKLEYQNTSLGHKIKNAFLEALLIGKSVTLGGDLSSVRQAAPLIVNLMFTDPKVVLSYFANMHKLAGLVPKTNPFKNPKQYVKDFIDGITNESIGEKLYQEMQAELKNSEDYDLIKKAGLFLTEEDAKLKAREESFQSHLVKFIPFAGKPIKLKNGKTIVPGLDLFGRGERSFAAMNEMRVKMFLNEVKNLEKVGITWETSPDTIKQVASVINTLGGRGEGGRVFEAIAPYLNFPFVSARFAKSRWDMTVLNPMAHYKIMKMTPAARKFAYKKMLGLHAYLAFMAGAAYLYANSDDDDEVKFGLNPTSTDFLKLKIGKNTSYDFNLGLQQLNRVALQLGYGKVTYANGEEVELNSQYGGPTYASVFGKYFLNKTNPMVGDAIKWSMDIKKDGDAKKSEEGIERYFLPMSYTLAKELAGEEDISTTDKVLGNFLSFYGVSNVDVYQPYEGPVRSLTNYDSFEKQEMDMMEDDSYDKFEKQEQKLLEGF